MNRICDETFINSGFDYDDIVAIRIENGEFYFLGWMEDADHYKIQMMTDYTFGKLMRDSISCGSLYSAITECDGYDQHTPVSKYGIYRCRSCHGDFYLYSRNASDKKRRGVLV